MNAAFSGFSGVGEAGARVVGGAGADGVGAGVGRRVWEPPPLPLQVPFPLDPFFPPLLV